MHLFQRLTIGRKLLLVAASGVALFGQGQLSSDRSEFEVTSVKPTNSTDGRALYQAMPGRLVMRNLVLRRLILIAYDVLDYQLADGPGWINSDHYDILAKSDGSSTVKQMEGPMLRALLKDRFGLTVHREIRQLPVYKLSLAKSGAKMQASKEGSCTPYVTDSPPVPTPGASRPNFCGFHGGVEGLNRTLDGEAVTMGALVSNLSRTFTTGLGRNVIDDTGLMGTFNIHLKWTMDPLAAVFDAAGDAMPPNLAGPSIFTALQEQLGLKLEPAKGPVEVLVIDHIEKPSAN